MNHKTLNWPIFLLLIVDCFFCVLTKRFFSYDFGNSNVMLTLLQQSLPFNV